MSLSNLNHDVNEVPQQGKKIQSSNEGSVDFPVSMLASQNDILGTDGDDNLIGTNDSDIINGLAGDDVLNGRFGNDTLDGGADFDLVSNAGGILNYIADLDAGTITADATVVELQNGPSSMAVFDAAILEEIYVHIHTVANPGGELRGQVNGVISDDTDSVTGVRTVVFNVDMLTGADHVPPVDTDALGLAELSFMIDGGTVTYSLNIIMEGLSVSDIMLVNLHEAPSGSNGPAVEDVLSVSGATLTAETDTDTLLNIEGIIGGLGNDNITGDSQFNFIEGGEGNDIVFGLGGDDLIEGGVGADLIDGGTGIDTASYVNSADGVIVFTNGRLGRDGEAEGDQLTSIENVIGSDAQDQIILNSTNSTDNTVNAGDGDDRIRSRDGGTDNLFGEDGNDNIFAGNSDGILDGGNGSDNLFGGAGESTLNGGDDNSRDGLFGGAGNDTLNGGGGNDALRGNTGNDILNGGDGGDTLEGGNQVDILNGDAGNDRLDGGSGNDTLNGGTGNDRLTGGLSNDLFIFENGSGIDRITDFNIGSGDQVDLSDFGLADFAAVMALATEVNGDVRIQLDADDRLILQDTTLASLDANDFILA